MTVKVKCLPSTYCNSNQLFPVSAKCLDNCMHFVDWMDVKLVHFVDIDYDIQDREYYNPIEHGSAAIDAQ